ncbi:MAG: shikimate kinase [Dinghuibacter sp.]|nr:shikimate kinase [Dinghuibacter sp.]
MHTRIYLTGYMASGKTVLGQQLATELGFRFFDLDELIEQHTGKTIPTIFETEGEPAFRAWEQEVLQQTFTWNNAVIACGGGTPCFLNNMEAMNSNGLTVWLHTPLATIISRLQQERHTRPLLANISAEELEQKVTGHYQTRVPFYRQAKVWFKPEQQTLAEMAALVQHK